MDGARVRDRRVERDEVSIYLDQSEHADGAEVSTEEWPGSSAQAAD